MLHSNTVQAVLRRMRAPVAGVKFVIIERPTAIGALRPVAVLFLVGI
jgi:hypothetical protein